MSKKKLWWLAVPLVAVVGIGVAAAGYKHHGYHKPERVVQRVSEALELDPEQRAKLDGVKEAFMESRREIRQEKKEAVNLLIEEVRKPELEQERIMELIEQRKARFDQLAPRVLKPLIDFHKSLSPDQREKIVNLLETFRDWGHGHRRHG